MAIHGQLTNKTAQERANLKATEIVRLGGPESFQASPELRIEIVSLAAIEGGVEALVRAWRNGQPQGFGPDGSIETERVRVFNPPLLVDDPTGPIVQTASVGERRLREDPAEALRQSLAHTVALIAKNGRNITPGKVGKTVSTFYSSTNDGRVYRYATDATWAGARDTTNGTGATTADTSERGNFCDLGGDNPGKYDLARSFFDFSTSAIGTDTISSATFSFSKVVSSFSNTNSTTLEVVQSTHALPPTTSDFHSFTYTSGGSLSYASLAAGYNDISLNATGLGFINKSGTTKLAMICGRDLNNTAPTGPNDPGAFYFADQTGTTNDPKLVVTHSASVDVTANASVVSYASALIAPTVTAIKNVSIAATVLAVASAPIAPSVGTGVSISPTVLSTASALVAPSVTAVQNVTASPSIVSTASAFGTTSTSAGPNSPSTVADDATIGTTSWTSPSNAKTEDGASATVDLGGVDPVNDFAIKLVKGGTISGNNNSAGALYGGTTLTYVSFGSSTDLWGLTLTPSDINASNFGVAYAAQDSNVSHYLKCTDFGFSIPSSATINGVVVEVKRAYSGTNGRVANVDHIRITIYYTVGATVAISPSVTPSIVAASASLIAPTVTAAQNLTVSPAVVSASAALLDPTVSADTGVIASPSAVSVTSAVVSPSVSLDYAVGVSQVSASWALIAPTITADSSIVATPSALVVSSAVIAPALAYDYSVSVSPVSAAFQLLSPRRVGSNLSNIAKHAATLTGRLKHSATLSTVAKHAASLRNIRKS